MDHSTPSIFCTCGVVLLIGPPGSGKSMLGQALAKTHPHTVHAVLNVGQELRNAGRLESYLRHPTEAARQEMRREARNMLGQACLGLTNSTVRAGTAAGSSGRASAACRVTLPKVLVLEFVKELDDAYELMDALQEYSLPLLQVLLLTDDLFHKLPRSSTAYSSQRDAEHLVESRRKKWRHNAAGLIEFFSALGVLVEVTVDSDSNSNTRGSTDTRRTLAGLGYAVGPHETGGDNTSTSRPEARASTSSSSNTRTSTATWLQRLGWCTSAGKLRCTSVLLDTIGGRRKRRKEDLDHVSLSCTLIQAVVSERLVTSSKERDTVVAAATASTGLSSLHAAVPGQSITSLADARWVAVSGRYHVSLKCDGTRHLLIVTDDGTPYLLNRAGMVYRYPIACSSSLDTSTSSGTCTGSSSSSTAATAAAVQPRLPPGTVLDGELVWVDELRPSCRDDIISSSSSSSTDTTVKATTAASGNTCCHRMGYFVAFDALAVGGKHVWQLPLSQRLAEVTKLGIAVAAADAASAFVKPATATGTATAPAADACKDGQHERGAASNISSTTATAASASDAAESSNSSSNSTNQSSSAAESPLSLQKKQQAPPRGSDTVHLLLKQHLPVSAAALQRLQAEKSLHRFPSDGLVFTPSDIPYAVGMSQLLIKWQPEAQIAIDMTGAEISAISKPPVFSLDKPTAGLVSKITGLVDQLHPHLLYECLPVKCISKEFRSICSRAQGSAWSIRSRKKEYAVEPVVVWVPHSIRWDKRNSKQHALREQVEQRTIAGLCVAHEQLAATVQQVQELIGRPAAAAAAAGSSSSNSSSAASRHPARMMEFSTLYSAVLEQVQLGAVERWIDPSGSGLEVFCYIISDDDKDTSTGGDKSSTAAAAAAESSTAVVSADSSSSSSSSSTGARKVPQHPIAAMCRGLALHPGSKTVVATPFARFGDAIRAKSPCEADNLKPSTSAPSLASSLVSSNDPLTLSTLDNATPGSGARLATSVVADKANLQLYTSWCAQPLASATFKLDGSFVIAYVWDGVLRVTTRRRMDSEQATWARSWLEAHINIHNMQPGCTYMFEAIYPANTHVIQYPFEGLVLLGAISPDGYELPSAAARADLAHQLGTMTVPCIHGSWDELLQRLGRGCLRESAPDLSRSTSSSQQRRSDSRAVTRSPASYEGWVLQAAEGQRCKLVQLSFKQTGHLAKHALHPLVTWDAVFCGASRSQILGGLPSHYQSEADLILAALDHQFWQVHKLLQQEVERAWVSEGCSSTAGAVQTATAVQQQLAELSLSAATAAADDRAPDGSNSVTQPIISTAAFQAALKYATHKQTHFVGSMFGSESESGAGAAGSSSHAAAIRGLLLECIRPSTDGTLPGYTPSPAFAQTYAKGWRRGPLEGRMSVLAGKPWVVPDEALIDIIRRWAKSHGSIGSWRYGREGGAMLVCRSWKQLIEDDPGFRAQAREWREQKAKGDVGYHRGIRHTMVDPSSDNDQDYDSDAMSGWEYRSQYGGSGYGSC